MKIKHVILVVCTVMWVFHGQGVLAESFWDKVKKEAGKTYEKVEDATRKTIEDISSGNESNNNSSNAESDVGIYNHDKASVLLTQKRLQKLGLYTSKTDGIYGPGTKTAIQKFEKIKGLSQSGNVTQELLAKLSTAVSAGENYASQNKAPATKQNKKTTAQTTQSNDIDCDEFSGVDKNICEMKKKAAEPIDNKGSNKTSGKVTTTNQSSKPTPKQKNTKTKLSPAPIPSDGSLSIEGVEMGVSLTDAKNVLVGRGFEVYKETNNYMQLSNEQRGLDFWISGRKLAVVKVTPIDKADANSVPELANQLRAVYGKCCSKFERRVICAWMGQKSLIEQYDDNRIVFKAHISSAQKQDYKGCLPKTQSAKPALVTTTTSSSSKKGFTVEGITLGMSREEIKSILTARGYTAGRRWMNKQRGLMISAVSKRIIIARDSHHSSYKSLNEIVSQIKEEHGEIPDCNPDTRKGCVWVTPDYTITYNDQSMGRTIVIESK